MIGGVYFLDDDDSRVGRHPCVVVLEITGSREFIVVPAFSCGRQQVEDALKALEAAGVPRAASVVTLENAKHLTLVRRIETYRAHWVTAQSWRLDAAALRRGKLVARMDAEGLRRICEALARYAELRPEQFSKPVLKRLRQQGRRP